MADYDELYDAGVEGEFINTVIEIPKGSMLKVEYDREKKTFILDRVEPGIFAKPVSYGFIPRTTDEDGDALDTLLICEEGVPMGVVVKATVIGVLNFVDGGEKDFKIICVPEDDRHAGNTIKSLDDLTAGLKQQIEHHFNHYKDIKKPGTTVVEGWGDAAAAWKVIADCKAVYAK
ncbi:MAG: ppa [Candidatus Saccharibacteria bacterium]|nr:ppa [Candidatus Saccharibacteria bacterium]